MGALECPFCGDDVIADNKRKAFICLNKACGYTDKESYDNYIWQKKMATDKVACVKEMIKEAIEEHDKEFKALILLLIQKGLVKDLNELKEVIQSMNVLEALDNKEE